MMYISGHQPNCILAMLLAAQSAATVVYPHGLYANTSSFHATYMYILFGGH